MEAYAAVYASQELTEEQIWEEVENWVNSLLEEGYDLSEYTWEEMYEAYIEEQSKEANMATWAKANPKLAAAAAERERTRGTSASTNPLMKGFKSKLPSPAPSSTSNPYKDTGAAASAVKSATTPSSSTAKSTPTSSSSTLSNLAKKAAGPTSFKAEGYDVFDVVISHLLDEGYADTEEAALVIMSNMSEEWRESIIEGNQRNPEEGEIRQRQSETRGQRTERKVRNRLLTMDPEKRKEMIAQMRAVGLNV